MIDFINIDWDDSDSRQVLEYFGILRRSTYLVIDPEGNILWQWIGPLDGDSVSVEFDTALENLQ